MTTNTDTKDRDLILTWVRKDATARNDFPGMPTSYLPLNMAAALQGMIRDGIVRIVERPAKVQNAAGNRMVSYVVEV